MALEDLIGNKYIDALNEDWPLGTDYPSDGDNHIRGVKNVLKKTFPNLTGPVTLTQEEINRGDLPTGTRILFYQELAPVGWTRVPVTEIATDAMFRLVPDGTDWTGGITGSDDPILNDKVNSHKHGVSGAVTTANATHQHTGYGISHDHSMPSAALCASGSDRLCLITTGSTYRTGQSGNTSIVVYSANAVHNHTFSVNSATPNEATIGAWSPRYLNMILCERD